MKKKMFDNSNMMEPIEWGNIPVGNLTDEELHSKNWNRGVALKGRKRPDQSARMSGENNSMAGKTHPNKGKTISKISEKLKGKKKPEGHGANVSAAKKGIPSPNKGKKRPKQATLMAGANNPMCRAIITPYGEFPSIKFVIEDHKQREIKNAERKIRQWLKEPESGYYYK